LPARLRGWGPQAVPEWSPSGRHTTSAADAVGELRGAGEGDILVNSSPSMIRPLRAADLVDRLYLLISPEIVGAGQRRFDDGLPASEWTLARHEAGALGEISLTYDRAR
jgi:dihydrofolate reductase